MPKITKKTAPISPKSRKTVIVPDKNKQTKTAQSGLNIKTLDNYLANKGLLIALSLILIIALIVFKDFIFMKFIYLFKDIGSDSINVDYPATVLIDKMYEQQHYFTWTFYSGMGYPMNSGLFNPLHPLLSAHSLLKPFFESVFGSNPAYLRFPVFFTILILTGLTAYLYFKTLNYSSFTSIVGSLMVSFMGYNIASSAWNHYYDVFYGIFLLFAFEQFYKKNRWYFMPIAVMMISFNFFNLYIYGSFLITYILFRFFSENEFNPKRLFLLGLKITGLTLWGLLMGIANFLPGLINAFNSPRVSENVDAISDIAKQNPLMKNHFYELSTAVLRTFSSDIMGTGSNFKGWYNYLEAPLFYCGLLSLLLIAQVFTFLNKKDKIVYGAFAGLWFLVVLIPGFRNAFHLFIGNYYKVGINFFIPIILIYYGIKSLSLIIENKKINLIALIISLLVLQVALFFPYQIENIELTDKKIRNFVSILLIFYTGLIYLLSREKYQLIAQIGILFLLIIEFSAFSGFSVSKRDNYKASEFRISEGGYNDNTMPALDYLKESDKNFYRTEKDYSSGTAVHGSLNDSQAQGYYGTSLYSSFNQPYYVDFLRETEIITAKSETETRWAPGLRSRPLLLTFASVKYNLSKSEKPFMLNAGYSDVKDFGDVKLLKNNYFIPFGYCYSRFITLSDFRKLSQLQKDIALLRAFVVDEKSTEYNNLIKNYIKLQISDTVAAFDFVKYQSFVQERRKDTLEIVDFKQNYIKGNLNTDSARMFFASIPFDKSWTVKVDGKRVEPQLVNIGFLGFTVLPGKHSIEMEYFPSYLYYAIILTVIGCLAFLILLFLNKELNKKIKISIFSILALASIFYIYLN